MRRIFRKMLLTALLCVASPIMARGDALRAQDIASDNVLHVNRQLVDDSVKDAEPFPAQSSFTIAVDAKIVEPGSEKGNDGSNGMLWNVGNGWDEGARLIYSWNDGRYFLQFGSKDARLSIPSQNSYLRNIKRSLVATYDATNGDCALYVDGVLAAKSVYKGVFDSKNHPLNVGFGGSGVGSIRLDVGDVRVWNRPLTPPEILALEATRPQQERDVLQLERLLAGSSNVAATVVDPAKLTEIDPSILPVELAESLERALVVSLIDRGFIVDRSLQIEPYIRLKTLVFDAAQKLLDSPATQDEPTVASLSRCGEIADWLERVKGIADANAVETRKLLSSTSFNAAQKKQFRADGEKVRALFLEDSARATQLMTKLAQHSPKESAVFRKIMKLEASAERVKSVERDALGMYYSLQPAPRSDKYDRVVYVAPDGNDETGDGSAEAPYATLARAFKNVEDFLAFQEPTAKPMRSVVRLAQGEYYMTGAATLKGASNVLVQGSKEGKTILTGAVKVANFTSLADAAANRPDVADAMSRVPESARPRVVAADLKAAGVDDLGSLANRGYHPDVKLNPIPTFTVEGKAQTLARWPNEGEKGIPFGEKVDDPSSAAEKTSTFRYDGDRLDGWRLDGKNDDIWAFGLYEWEWAANLRRVVAIDREKKTLTFDYENGSGRFDYYFVNVLEELDAPGEYYVDRATGYLYYYLPETFADAAALNATSPQYDVFEGRFVELENVSNALFTNLTFKGGRETALVMKDCDCCYLSDSTIEEMGGNGVVILDGKFCGVVKSRLRSLGACGVRITGGDCDTLTQCRHLVHNCYVSDFGRIDRVYAPAVLFRGCGCAITQNLFCDSPHHGMRTDGNDIYIARNEVHSVVYEYSDQSGVDIFCDPSFRGIVIEKNLWRHIGSAFALCGQAGIRLDDTISGVVMRENVFYRSAGGIFGGIQIHGGKDNLVKNNAFVDCLQALSFSPWGAGRYTEFAKTRFPKHIGNALFEETYPFFDELFEHENRNYVIDNKAINCPRFNNKGSDLNVFVGNTTTHETPDLAKLGVKTEAPYADLFMTNSTALRAWLTSVTGISLKGVGLLDDWKGAGENVSPHFSEARE